MGNGPSSRRNGRNSNPLGPPPPPQVIPPPPGYPSNHAPHHGPPGYMPNNIPSYYYPQNFSGPTSAMPPPFYQNGYGPQSNGQHMMNYQQQFRPPPQNPTPPAHTPPPPPSVAETQKANTIRNDVNLRKATLRLEKDGENPGFHLVAFSFDANVAGSVSIFFFAKEKGSCAFTLLKPHLCKVSRAAFEKGIVQKFRQAPGSGVNLSMFDDRDLAREGEGDVFPLVVRTETLGKDPPADFSLLDNLPVGEPVPEYVHCQTTQAVIERKEDGDYKVRVIKQNIWVDGVDYELQEIYGIENSGGSGGFDGSDAAKECVICMSEPRNTTVLPCRHMCMCGDCAKVLRFQTNRCPICRTPVERLLEINVPPTGDNFDLLSEMNGASASQSSAYPSVGQSSSSPGEGAWKRDTTKVPGASLQDADAVAHL